MSTIEVRVPNIGDFTDIPVIEVLINVGDAVKPDDPLIALESDKATLEVPADAAGKVSEIVVNIGDRVSEGSLILRLEPEQQKDQEVSPANTGSSSPLPSPLGTGVSLTPDTAIASAGTDALAPLPALSGFGGVNASPSVRRLARELDIDLNEIAGSGEKGRITKSDVKAALGTAPLERNSLAVPHMPEQDFGRFGAVTAQPMTRLKRLSGPHLHRAWLNVPHVTHTDEADITDLEIYRKQLDADAKIKGFRVTLLPFLMMASVAALKQFPEFNASLSPEGGALILKHYYNIGVAVDTPDGLVVPVIRDVDRKRVIELSQELSATSHRMREGKIAPADIQGGTFSISSLGGIGGTSFTPIVNAPEVAILGVVRATIRPVWNGDKFTPRLMLPLCLSYDHRVIDGASAARFTSRLVEILGDVRQLVL
ncbi:Dihydrolipoamide acetyltransferase component of pyruvate dehydrogenase complex [Hyphomicrobium sulfonivorans]|uniref:Dihydrolipoamide acetyltransferase component of pyruvate dehydrogenase complex n=1 Tax=Hyphomicrobium sulfonivorans TaxID=121290 RepID=A0A125NVC3_HYPSL|nr:2-oxo acid dehydrogenase subunit E2 [Hyphomicrobium sulfonivorans]KWT69313.1 Dihydrolipoamide acetyltransferase component of pyruvate dehydrogenase complex [Hyphomicrobium sulfonivorans]